MAELLSSVNVPCGHERQFTGRRTDNIDARSVIADSSWMAAPFLDRLPKEALVLHQTRNPIAVVMSHVARGFFDSVTYERPLWKHALKRVLGRPPSGQFRLTLFVRDVLPNVYSERTPIQRAARFWIEWNSLVDEHATVLRLDHLRYRLEDIEAEFLSSVVDKITGANLTLEASRRALEKVPTTVNQGLTHRPVSSGDLGPLRDELVAKARSYGYHQLEDQLEE